MPKMKKQQVKHSPASVQAIIKKEVKKSKEYYSDMTTNNQYQSLS